MRTKRMKKCLPNKISIGLLFNLKSYSTTSAVLWNYNLNDSVLGIREQTDGITRVEYLNFKSSMDEYRVNSGFEAKYKNKIATTRRITVHYATYH